MQAGTQTKSIVRRTLGKLALTLFAAATAFSAPVQAQTQDLTLWSWRQEDKAAYAKFIAAFRKQNPALQIAFDVLASDSMLTGIAEGRYDIGLSDSNIAHEGIANELLLETQAICILPHGHHLASYDVIRPEDLHDEQFVALSRRHSSRAKIDRLFDQAGIRVQPVIETSTNVSLVEFVRGGLGVSLLNPFPMIHQIGDQIAVRPFVPAVSYSTNFLTPASRAPSAATQAFIQYVRDSFDRDAYPGTVLKP